MRYRIKRKITKKKPMNPKKYDAEVFKSMTLKLNDELKTMINNKVEIW